MPTDDGLRLDDDQRITPSRPETVEEYPEDAVRCSQTGAWLLGLEDGKLLAKRHVLKGKI